MEKRNPTSPGPRPRRFPDKLIAPPLQFLDRGVDVRHFEAEVVDARTPFLQKGADRGSRIGRAEQFDVGARADGEERDPHFFGGDEFLGDFDKSEGVPWSKRDG